MLKVMTKISCSIFLLSLTTQLSVWSAPVSYTREVRPILAENCFYCHGQDGNKRKADLQLNTMAGQRDGKTVIPGNAEASELVKRLFTEDQDELMPPPDSNRHVSSAQRELLKRWVQEGANFEEHWAFIAPQRPNVSPTEGAANAIDSLVAAKHREHGVTFSPEADKTTLIRRLYLDLIGLPPSPEEVDAFLADSSPDAYAKVVEKLLAMPQFGERMALPWLDAARYADSNGFQQEGDTHQYFWRDWVVRAYNADMPFDQFSTEQLAGDLLEKPTEDQLVATGFNRNHMLNGEGGAIAEEQRNNVMFDRVDTTATNWLGLTMACAQCHDHKYDPITQTDYYSLFSYFNNVPETGVPPGGGQYRIADPWIPVGTEEQKAKMVELDALAANAKKNVGELTKKPEIQKELAEFETVLASNREVKWSVLKPEKMASTEAKTTFTIVDVDTSILVGGESPDRCDYTITMPLPEGKFTGLRLETIPDDRLPKRGAGRGDSGNAVLTGMKVTVDGKEIPFTNAYANFSQPGFSAMGVIDKDANTGWAFYPEVRKPYTLAFECGQPVDISAANSKMEVRLEFQSQHQQHALGRFRLSATSDAAPASQVLLPDNIAKIVKTENRSKADAKALRDYVERNHAPVALKELQNKAKEADEAVKNYRQELPRVMVMSDAKPRQTKRLDRGDYLTPKEDVSSNSPAFLPSMPPELPKNRLGFAKWLFRPEHPLAARVQVNRLWQYFFGVGLVKTSEDLGVQSEVPVQQELLDWLAVEFREMGWSQKHLIRLITQSRTYKQTSRVNPEAWQKDPENRLMARGSRFRMPSMVLRDMALQASGLMNPKMFGKPVYPYQPDSVWETLAITKERDFTYPASHGDELYRRSLYTFWRRTIGPTNMFDASARQACKVRVGITSTPLHALTTLNDVTWVEASRVLAEKAYKAAPDAAQRLAWAFRRVVSRAATSKDLETLVKSYDKQLAFYNSDPKAAEDLLAVGEAAGDKTLPKAEHAALTTVCLGAFNLDEALTRE
jgi:hypothetical protein